jgi:hypothetical protein
MADLHAYTAASNGNCYGAQKAVVCAAKLIVGCADEAPYTRISLKIDPVRDRIRSRPNFQQLLSGPEQIGPNKYFQWASEFLRRAETAQCLQAADP